MHRTRCFCRVAVVSRRPSRVSCSVRKLLFLVAATAHATPTDRPGAAPALRPAWAALPLRGVPGLARPHPQSRQAAARSLTGGGPRSAARTPGCGGDGRRDYPIDVAQNDGPTCGAVACNVAQYMRIQLTL